MNKLLFGGIVSTIVTGIAGATVVKSMKYMSGLSLLAGVIVLGNLTKEYMQQSAEERNLDRVFKAEQTQAEREHELKMKTLEAALKIDINTSLERYKETIMEERAKMEIENMAQVDKMKQHLADSINAVREKIAMEKRKEEQVLKEIQASVFRHTLILEEARTKEHWQKTPATQKRFGF
jgi:hypothetical protein